MLIVSWSSVWWLFHYLPKSLLSSVSPIATGYNRFCAVEFRDSGAVSYLVVCVYMPAFVDSSSHLGYLNTLGELQGFIDAQQFHMLIIVGDFNVDFDRQGPLVPLLLEFMSENCLVASDVSYLLPELCLFYL